jgi:hypothetical protein
MDSSSNNGPLMAMTLAVGLGALSVTGVLSSIVVAVLVGALGKAVDVALRALIARRESYWRREAQRLAAELKRMQRDGDKTTATRLSSTKRTNAEPT